MKTVKVVGSYFKDDIQFLSHKKKSVMQWENHGGICNLELPNFIKYPTDYNATKFVINSKGEDCVIQRDVEEAQENALEVFASTPSHWTHFAYLNTIKGNLDTDRFKGIKSCDIAVSSRENITNADLIKNIKPCHYVFFSEETEKKYPEVYKEIYNNSSAAIIYHSKIYSCVTLYGKVKAHVKNEPRNFYFTTGAGDRFAMFFIQAALNQNCSTQLALEYANQETVKWLEGINAKL
jgi:hypothetical protein